MTIIFAIALIFSVLFVILLIFTFIDYALGLDRDSVMGSLLISFILSISGWTTLFYMLH